MIELMVPFMAHYLQDRIIGDDEQRACRGTPTDNDDYSSVAWWTALNIITLMASRSDEKLHANRQMPVF
jgi:hypothetical protein